MPSLTSKSTLKDHQEFVRQVYGLHNDRYYTTPDILVHMQRFCMRGLKGIRKNDKERTALNLFIALSWFMSLMNQLHIDLQEAVAERFPNACSYCGERPCVCKAKKIQKRKGKVAGRGKKPKTIAEFQAMFEAIYPASSRTLEHAGIHLGEEVGELAEAIQRFRSGRKTGDFDNIAKEAADVTSCMFGVFNSWDVDVARELSSLFSFNCHACRKAPCVCDFQFVENFRS